MKLSNLTIFTIASSVWGLAMGLFGPFYVLYVQEIGGSIETLGFAFGIMVIAQSLTSYFAGRLSDKFGRKPFLILVGYLNAVVFFAYTLIETVLQLYILQAMWGILDAIDLTVGSTFLADMTKKHKRGAQIGKFRTIIGLSSGIAMMIGGFIVGIYGLKIIFYACALFYFLSTSILFLLKERRK